jgi:hypothetical protein
MLEAALAQFWQFNPTAKVTLVPKPAVTETTEGALRPTHVLGASNLPEALAHPKVRHTESMDEYLSVLADYEKDTKAAADARKPAPVIDPLVLSQRGEPITTEKEPAELTVFLPLPDSQECIKVRGPLQTIAMQTGVVVAALTYTKGDVQKAMELISIVPGAPPPT